MAPSLVQLTGGNFQDSEGHVLALGTLVLELSQDEQLSSLAGQVASGIKITLLLNSSGSVSTSPAQYVWPTDVMNPSGASYTVWAYTANGQLAWGPNYGLTVPSGATYDIDNWVPNSTTGGGGAAVGSILLQSNGVNNGDQAKLNLHSSDSSVTITDDGSGDVNLQVAGSGGPRPSRGRWAYTNFANASGDGGVYTAVAMNPTHYLDGGGSTAVLTNASATSGPKWTLTAPLIVEEYDQTLQVTPGVLVDYQMAAGFYQSNIKQYIGLSDNAAVNTGYNAVANMIAFRFDPVTAGDTHWMCQAQISNMAPTVVSTGVTPDATGALHIFEVQMIGGVAHYYIDGVAVGTIAAVHLPATTTLLGLFTTADVAGGAGSQAKLSVSTMYWETSS